MLVINSERAKKILENPKAIVKDINSSMRRYPSEAFKVWASLDLDQNRVKNLSFAGELNSDEKIILESLASLMNGKPLSVLDGLSLRECEAYLRDRNSQTAFDGITPELEAKFKKFFGWIRGLPLVTSGENYHYASTKGDFRNLKLVEKVKELKAFLASAEVLELYQNTARPELVDVDGLTVYVQVAYESEEDKALFEELHLLGVATFQEENLNFIPEA